MTFCISPITTGRVGRPYRRAHSPRSADLRSTRASAESSCRFPPSALFGLVLGRRRCWEKPSILVACSGHLLADTHRLEGGNPASRETHPLAMPCQCLSRFRQQPSDRPPPRQVAGTQASWTSYWRSPRARRIATKQHRKLTSRSCPGPSAIRPLCANTGARGAGFSSCQACTWRTAVRFRSPGHADHRPRRQRRRILPRRKQGPLRRKEASALPRCPHAISCEAPHIFLLRGPSRPSLLLRDKALLLQHRGHRWRQVLPWSRTCHPPSGCAETARAIQSRQLSRSLSLFDTGTATLSARHSSESFYIYPGSVGTRTIRPTTGRHPFGWTYERPRPTE